MVDAGRDGAVGRLRLVARDEIDEAVEFVESLVAGPDVSRLRANLEEAEELLADLRRRKAVYDTMQPGDLPPLPKMGGTRYHNNPERWDKDLREWWRREVREDAFGLKDDLRRDTWDIPKEQRATAVRASAEGQPYEISSKVQEVLDDIDLHASTVRLEADQSLTRSMRLTNDEDFKWLDWWTDPDVGDEITAAMPDSWSLDANWSAQFTPTKFVWADEAVQATQSVDVVMTIRGGERVRMMPVHSAKAHEYELVGPAGARYRVISRRETTEAVQTGITYQEQVGTIRRIHLEVEEVLPG